MTMMMMMMIKEEKTFTVTNLHANQLLSGLQNFPTAVKLFITYQ